MMDNKPVYSVADDNLIVQMLSGNTEAMEFLYEQTKDTLYAFALVRMKNAEEAKKCVINTYIRIWKDAADYKLSTNNLLRWILKKCRSECTKAKRSKIDRMVDYDSVCNTRPFLNAIMNIPQSNIRQVFILRAVAGLSFKDIEYVMELPIFWIQNVCLRRIKSILKEYEAYHTRKEIMCALNLDVQGLAPDMLEDIMSGIKQNTRDTVDVKFRKSRKTGYTIAIVTLAVIVLGCAVAQINYLLNMRDYLSFDTVPTVVMTVDGFQHVRGLKSSDENMTFDMDNIKDRDVDSALEYVGSVLHESGYVSEEANTVLLTVQLSREIRTDAIRKTIETKINDPDSNSNGVAIVFQDISNGKYLSKNSDFDAGKDLFVDVISQQLDDCSEEDLAQLSVQDLTVLCIKRELSFDNIEIIGTPSVVAYQGDEKAQKIVDSIDASKYTVEQQYSAYNGQFVIKIYVSDESSTNTIIINAKTGSLITIQLQGTESLVEQDDVQEIIEPGSTNKSNSSSYSSGNSGYGSGNTNSSQQGVGDMVKNIIEDATQPHVSDSEKASNIISDATGGAINIDPSLLDLIF